MPISISGLVAFVFVYSVLGFVISNQSRSNPKHQPMVAAQHPSKRHISKVLNHDLRSNSNYYMSLISLRPGSNSRAC
ncbi:hypothetical protein EDB80DRAFT_729911 [Ilyonectria destructans]|nr:hypothetical protein EDB80DRAFT_729911 [Ilyonectria destructans]